MIKNRKSTSYKNRSRNKKSNRNKSSKVFMKKSFISPSLQINHLNDLNNENFIESPAPVASQALNSDEYIDNNETGWDEFDEEGRDSDNSDNSDKSDNDYGDDEEQYIDKENDSYATSIKNKDLRIFKMKFILEEKKKQMFEKEQEVKELQKYNSFLESVITDYENYNRSILEEKNKQKTAIKILSDHIRDISNEMKTDDYKLNRVKGDQRILLDELQNIRNELRQALALNGRKNEYISSDEDEYN
jgi:hypothetical protein